MRIPNNRVSHSLLQAWSKGVDAYIAYRDGARITTGPMARGTAYHAAIAERHGNTTPVKTLNSKESVYLPEARQFVTDLTLPESGTSESTWVVPLCDDINFKCVIDFLGAGALIDYKTGKPKIGKNGLPYKNKGYDLQLSRYAWALLEIADIDNLKAFVDYVELPEASRRLPVKLDYTVGEAMVQMARQIIETPEPHDIEFAVVGVTFRPNYPDTLTCLTRGGALELRREPQPPKPDEGFNGDEHAVAVYNGDEMIGFLPAHLAPRWNGPWQVEIKAVIGGDGDKNYGLRIQVPYESLDLTRSMT